MGIREARQVASEYARDEMGWAEAKHVGEIPVGAGEIHVFRLRGGHLLGLGVEPGAWGDEEVTSEWDEFQMEEEFPSEFARIAKREPGR